LHRFWVIQFFLEGCFLCRTLYNARNGIIIDRVTAFTTQARSQGGVEAVEQPPPLSQALKGPISADSSSANILNIVRLWNRSNKIEYTYYVDLSFDHKVAT